MYPSSITLTGDAASSQTYDQISLIGGKCIRDDAARDLGTPRSMIVSHETKGTGLSAVDRHLVRLNLVEEDDVADAIATVSSSVYLVIEAPRRIVTKAMIEDQVTQLVDFLTTAGYMDKFLNSEP